MAALGDDCYFFCTSTCTKGAACPFRHVEAAKACRIICQHWQMGGCLRPMCKFRHADFKIHLNPVEVPCYWESQPTGCTKKNCVYKHLKPRPQDDVATTVPGSVDSSTIGAASGSEVVTSQNLVQPVVPPVVIQPSVESEESNSSPIKRPPEVTPVLQDASKVTSKKQDIEHNKDIDENRFSERHQDQIVKKKTKKVAAATAANKIKKKIAIKKKLENKTAGKRLGKISGIAKKTPERVKKSVKERLGKRPLLKPAVLHSSEKSESESGSDSDDSIENIKVMSMEEILRQKALESMLKKRGTEGVASLSATEKNSSFAGVGRKMPSIKGKRSFPTVQRKALLPENRFEKHPAILNRNKHSPASVESSSSSSEEDSSDEEDSAKQSSENSASCSSEASSASSSTNSDEDSADSEEFDVRRVVVDLEGEKAARKKAKASFLRKQKLNIIHARDGNKKGTVVKPTVKQINKVSPIAQNKVENRKQLPSKRMVNVDYDSDDIVSSRVKKPLKISVRDRLGMPTALHKASSEAHLLSRAEKFGSVPGHSGPVVTKRVDVTVVKSSKSSSSSEDDHDPLAEVKIKTLEEIKLEKMKKQEGSKERKVAAQESETATYRPLSVKQRLGTIPSENQNKVEDSVKGRQVVLVKDSGTKSDDSCSTKPSDEQKKARKRPWRSQKRNVDPSLVHTVDDDERTMVVTSGTRDGGDDKEDLSEDDRSVNETPFERLRRRALMKKLQGKELKKLNLLPPVDEVTPVETDLKTSQVDRLVMQDTIEVKKHKHRHKHHKKVKTERQIYMPPAMKNTVTISKPQSPENLFPKRETLTAPTAKVSPLKREPHPIAALWAAGLSLSSKGTSGMRKPESMPPAAESFGNTGRVEIGERLGVREAASKPKEIEITTKPRGINVSTKPVGIGIAVVPKGIEMAAKPKEKISSNQLSQSSMESSGVKIKSFSEIMAEKRKKRLEMQAQKSGNTNHSTSDVVESSSARSLLTSSSVSVPAPSNQSNTTSSSVAEAKPQMPVSPIVFTTDISSDSAQKSMLQLEISSNAGLKATVHPTIATFTSQTVTSTNLVPSETVSPQYSITKPAGQKMKGASAKNSVNKGEKKKKVKKSLTKKEGNDDRLHLASFDIHSNPLPSSFVKSAPSETVRATSSKITSDGTPSSSQLSLEGVNSERSYVGEVCTKTGTPSGKPRIPSTSKHSLPANTDSETSKKKSRLSMEDEFNFFEDEFLNDEDAVIPESTEQIDDLLQDIDELLA